MRKCNDLEVTDLIIIGKKQPVFGVREQNNSYNTPNLCLFSDKQSSKDKKPYKVE
jgi:hypothetical protein